MNEHNAPTVFVGVLISSSAKDVKNIVTSLRIQVDNPICILNQDTSRNFLSSNDPKQKFILFKRATRLETLYEEYNKIKLNQQEAVEIFGNKESVSNIFKHFLIIKHPLINVNN